MACTEQITLLLFLEVARLRNLDLLWLRDSTLEDSENLPDPGVVVAEVVADRSAALHAFQTIAQNLDSTEAGLRGPVSPAPE